MRDKLNHKTLKWLPLLPILMQESFWCKLQALVYDILPSTTTVFSYATGPRKMSANEQFIVGAPTVIRCYKQLKLYRRLFYVAILLTPAQIKPKSFESTRNSLLLFFFFFFFSSFFFTRGGCPSHVYVRAWALGCFHSLISTQTFRRALTASVDSCAEIKSVPSEA